MQSKLAKLLTVSVLATSFVFAQNQRTPPDPATMVQHRVSRLTTLLTLTAAQQQQATTIFTAAATADQTARASLQTARQNLNTAIKNNDAGGIDQAATTIGSLTAQTTLSDAKAQAAFLQILTPDQVTKYNQLGAGGRGFGRGGPATEGFHGGR
jgi:Spy/CpxP family protein refolding chaperone